ncbi:MAG: hypothetical protein JXJ17_01695 [Anaerolineae bacterium]|nr:hypothetical protein [Anaerolineae bacterium]
MKSTEPRDRITWLIWLSLAIVMLSIGQATPALASQADDCSALQGYCGDGYCDHYAGENSSNCPEDCEGGGEYRPPNATIIIWADPVTILRGECTYLKWTTEDVLEGFLSGGEYDRYPLTVPDGEMRVCPLGTTTYIFTAFTERGDQRAFVTVEVVDSLAVSGTPTPTPTGSLRATATPRSGVVVVVVTATPEETATGEGTPTETPKPRSSPTPSPTPAEVPLACGFEAFESRLFAWRNAYQDLSPDEYPTPVQADDEEVYVCELPPTGQLCFPIYEGLLEATGGSLDQVRLIECTADGVCEIQDWPAEAQQNMICFDIDPLSGLSCADGCAMIMVPKQGALSGFFQSGYSWILFIFLGLLLLIALAIIIIIFFIRRRKEEDDAEEDDNKYDIIP